MEKYLVRSGDLEITVESNVHRVAAIKAIDEYSPLSLGELISVLKEGDSEDEEVFMKTEWLLSIMGYELENEEEI
jgi:hypothetical protein